MKKTLLALTVTSIFSGAAFAAVNPNTDADHTVSIQEIQDSGVQIIRDYDPVSKETNYILVDAEMNKIADVDVHNHKGKFTITNDEVEVNYDARTQKGDVKAHGSDSKQTIKVVDIQDLPDIDGEKRPNDRNNDQNNHNDGRLDSITKELAKVVHDGNTVKIGDIEVNRGNLKEASEIYNNLTEKQKKELYDYATNSEVEVKKDIDHDRNNDQNNSDVKKEREYQMNKAGLERALENAHVNNKEFVIDGEKYTALELRNNFADLDEKGQRAVINELKEMHKNGDTNDIIKVVDGETNNGGSNKVIDEDTRNGEISTEVDKRIAAADQKVRQEAAAYATAVDKQLANHEGRISSLEKDMKEMGNKMLVLEDRMDGVVASSHAITNARPVLSQAGQYGVGVGVGHAGSKQAVALGGAMQFTENWSGSMSVNYETKGKVSSDQFSAGVGAQYVF
ncbi:hypothetical protein VIOR3934_00265 [Vibrio orientalis CIP 102891 = ATCC 33934]|uniref:Trimeric autotransporter adhesin YadA-like C-terminal membrane anchor domain-containing protein n=1 Tax=Vibrio orientalis CIP 102891 = ATCC 33934 TaxID=675816 RepID=C9QGR5_VIBOR|nr:YadA C-terminal domain-containing protein [Vibrio orientalis]EEX93776.1 hypothetical protein VIA_000933 [Vibrio orientalis CIP 102891 = ATCC 33934]EGU50784.1 hypothetical protein VIOR3934_00265 [Vibrio orientalis CIP 102891 = ATCC 33934]